MTISDLVRRSGRSLRSAKGRTVLTAMAIAVGAFALTLTLAASTGAQGYVNKIISENFDPAELLVANDEQVIGGAGGSDTSKPREFDPSFGSSLSNAGATTQVKYITSSDIEKLRKVEGVERVREDVSVNLSYVTREGSKKFIGTLSAINPFLKPEILAGSIPNPLTQRQLVLPEGYVEALGFNSAQDAVGKKMTLSFVSLGKSITEDFTIVAVTKKPTNVQPGTELYLLAGQEDAVRINDLVTKGTPTNGRYLFVFVKAKDGTNNSKLIAVQERIESLGFVAQSVKETQEFLNQIISILQGIVVAFGLIAIVASVFGIINTMYISVLSRTREIGLMKALGMRKRDIGRLFRFEAAWIGFLGGFLGSLLAVLLGFGLNPWISKQLSLGDDKLLVFQPMQIGVLILILVIVSILAGWLPSRKAAKLDPIEALRTE